MNTWLTNVPQLKMALATTQARLAATPSNKRFKRKMLELDIKQLTSIIERREYMASLYDSIQGDEVHII